MTDNVNVSDEEEFYASTYSHYLTLVKTLAEDAEVQCAIRRYDNVAWELKNFTIDSTSFVLDLPGGKLSEAQRKAIMNFGDSVNSIPTAVVNVTNTRENHRRAMRDPHWQPIRKQAAELLEVLDSETRRVDKILWPNESD